MVVEAFGAYAVGAAECGGADGPEAGCWGCLQQLLRFDDGAEVIEEEIQRGWGDESELEGAILGGFSGFKGQGWQH
jgi:hypothetical protein